MNLSIKKTPWMVASLLVATSLFGQTTGSAVSQSQTKANQPTCPPVKPTCAPQVCKPAKPAVCGIVQEPQMPTIAAYNAPAEIYVGMQGDCDLFVNASFLYWQPLQDNMDVAASNQNLLADIGTAGLGWRGNMVDMSFSYKPGFKVGTGINFRSDDWVGYAEYTRIHGTHHVSSSVDPALPNIFATRGHPFILSTFGQVFSSVNAHYACHLDFVDGQLERVYYVGQNLIFHSSFGMRGAWILQRLQVAYDNITPVVSPLATNSVTNVTQRVHSWAVGPRGGLKMDWMLGASLGDGFRFYGNTFADILYTKYKVQDKTAVTVRAPAGGLAAGETLSAISRDNKVPTLRAHMEMELGLGWGSYWSNNDWHFDFSAGYTFQAFFNQNMFPRFQDDVILGIHSEENGNLYVQGLNVSARIDF